MSSPAADSVRRQVRAAREMKGWDQRRLAEAARISRGTVQNVERGAVVSEGKEAAIERALGWKIGSIDLIRNGGEPVLVNDVTRKPLHQLTRVEAFDRAEEIYIESRDEKKATEFINGWLEAKRVAETRKAAPHDAL